MSSRASTAARVRRRTCSISAASVSASRCRRLVENERAALGAQLAQACARAPSVRRQESFEHETIGRAGRRRTSAAIAALGPGTGTTSMPCSRAATHETPTGIADQRRARVAHERDGRAARAALEKLGDALALVVLVIRELVALPRQYAIAIPGCGAYPRPQSHRRPRAPRVRAESDRRGCRSASRRRRACRASAAVIESPSLKPNGLVHDRRPVYKRAADRSYEGARRAAARERRRVRLFAAAAARRGPRPRARSRASRRAHAPLPRSETRRRQSSMRSSRRARPERSASIT